MNSKLIFLSLSIVFFVFVMLAFSVAPKDKLSVKGVWSIVEVQTIKPDGTITSALPKESEAIFSNVHYSFCWTSHISTIRDWAIADSIKLVRLNQSIINTGTYELKDSILTTKAAFAINPMFVNGLAVFKCSFRGDTLVLTGLSVNSSDNIPNPLYAGGSHIVNKLLKVKDN